MSDTAYNDEAITRLRICTDRDVPDGLFIDAAIAAIEENPDNAPFRRRPGGPGRDTNRPVELALETEKRWKPGRTLRVTFLDGDPAIQQRVKDIAKTWETYANLRFEFVDGGEADIRVSFQLDGSWSYLGTDNLVIPVDEATMNYGWLDGESTEDEYRRVVLHEFGHAMAAIHEHQSPNAGIPWDEDKVYRYYSLTAGWDKAKVDHNVLGRYDASKTNASEYDPTSIMQYPVDNALTVGDFAVGWNSDLSDQDMTFMAQMYPKAAPTEPLLEPGVPVSAEIGEPGEEDHFRFSLADQAEVTLETGGPTDVVIALFGPNSRTRLLDSDDDSGRSLNARIRAVLDSGDYYVRIRHYSLERGGPYTVTLTI